MKGAASIDDHAALIKQIMKHGGHSYDLADHQQIPCRLNKFSTNGVSEALPK